jgi:hypothetical protein
LVFVVILKSSVLLRVFCGQRIFIKKCFLLKFGSVCRIKRFTTGSRYFLMDIRKSQMMPDKVALLRLRQKQLCSEWKS